MGNPDSELATTGRAVHLDGMLGTFRDVGRKHTAEWAARRVPRWSFHSDLQLIASCLTSSDRRVLLSPNCIEERLA